MFCVDIGLLQTAKDKNEDKKSLLSGSVFVGVVTICRNILANFWVFSCKFCLNDYLIMSFFFN